MAIPNQNLNPALSDDKAQALYALKLRLFFYPCTNATANFGALLLHIRQEGRSCDQISSVSFLDLKRKINGHYFTGTLESLLLPPILSQLCQQFCKLSDWDCNTSVINSSFYSPKGFLKVPGLHVLRR